MIDEAKKELAAGTKERRRERAIQRAREKDDDWEDCEELAMFRVTQDIWPRRKPVKRPPFFQGELVRGAGPEWVSAEDRRRDSSFYIKDYEGNVGIIKGEFLEIIERPFGIKLDEAEWNDMAGVIDFGCDLHTDPIDREIVQRPMTKARLPADAISKSVQEVYEHAEDIIMSLTDAQIKAIKKGGRQTPAGLQGFLPDLVQLMNDRAKEIQREERAAARAARRAAANGTPP